MTAERDALDARIDAALRPLVIYESTDGQTTRKVLADDALRLQSVLRDCRAALAAQPAAVHTNTDGAGVWVHPAPDAAPPVCVSRRVDHTTPDPAAAPAQGGVCVVCGASILARCDSALCPQFLTVPIGTQQEQYHDDESNGRRARGMAGEGDEGYVQTRGGDGARGRYCPGEHGAGLLHSQQHADPRRGNATRAFPLLIDNETLRQQIAADPDDEPSAGNAAPAQGEPQDYISAASVAKVVAKLTDWKWLAEYASDGWNLPSAGTDALALLAGRAAAIMEKQADAIAALRAENERQAREIAEWRTWGTIEVAIRNPNVASSMNHWEQRAKRAEAECEKLRAFVDGVAEGDCHYNDGCTDTALRRHGQCFSCAARAAIDARGRGNEHATEEI